MNIKKIYKKINHFFLRFLAFSFLQPIFHSGRWQLCPKVKKKLKPHVLELFAEYEKVCDFFRKSGICMRCSGNTTACCGGSYNRFNVFDYLIHVIAEVDKPIPWGYKLYPFNSSKKNFCNSGICDYLVIGKGCSLPQRMRPAMCIWGICNKVENDLTPEQRIFLDRFRNHVDKIQWNIVFSVICNGLERCHRHTC